jgi:tetratricopeptide (TPR) repeat protein
MGRLRILRLSSLLLACAAGLGCGVSAFAQSGRVVLVLPFENRSGNASLNWVGDSFPDTLDARLSSAGFLTISHDDRVYAFDHLGLPADFRPSRATTIRIAQQLDANYVVIGSYTTQPGYGGANVSDRLAIQAQVLSVDELRLSQPVQDSADLARLFDAENAIAWKVARVLDPHLNVAEGTFLAAAGAVPLPAFEQYIRGIDAPTQAERLKRLQDAVNLSPNYAAALLALGKEQYASKDFTAAAGTLARVPQTSPLALEAGFYLGLSRFNANNYAGAETAFSFVEHQLPLPEVINNEAVSMSRQGKDAADVFRRASAADPNDAEYHYNYAISLWRRGDTAAALREADAALHLKPDDQDFGHLRSSVSVAVPGTRLSSSADSTYTPVERIRRTYSEASYRQVAFQLEQLREARIASLPPAQAAAEYLAQGRDAFNRNQLPEAEKAFTAAVAADPNNADAHLALAGLREKSGDLPDARNEAAMATRLQPSANAFVTLARIDLATNNLAAAADDVTHALRLEPHNAAAIALRLSLQQRGQAVR